MSLYPNDGGVHEYPLVVVVDTVEDVFLQAVVERFRSNRHFPGGWGFGSRNQGYAARLKIFDYSTGAAVSHSLLVNGGQYVVAGAGETFRCRTVNATLQAALISSTLEDASLTHPVALEAAERGHSR